MSQAVGIRAKGGLNLREGVGDEPTACMGRLRFELRTNRLKANLDRSTILSLTGLSLRRYREGTNDNLRHHKTPLWVPPCDTGPEYVL